jgi:transposase, IS30 family
MAHEKKRRPKCRHYQHLSVFDRARIGLKYNEGMHVKDIAALIKRNRSTVIRELARNGSGERLGYRPEAAHKKAFTRREKRGVRPLLKNDLVRTYVTTKLKDGWSPEQIHLRLPLDCKGEHISYEAIYQYVYAHVNPGGTMQKGHEDLRLHLARRHKRRQKKGFRATQKLYQTPLPSIEDRPLSVERRKEVGHWEDDCIVSRESTNRLKSINERVSGIVLLGKMNDGTIAESNRVVIDRLSEVPARLRKTLTRDRGTENLGWKEIEKELRLTCYFAHAYCSQERGSNENLNGLVRRVYPKKTDFRNVSDTDLRQLEYKLNSRPRKRFGGKTPLEVFYERTGCALVY